MTELEKEYLYLRNRKAELEDWLQDVNYQIVEVENKIANDSKIIRIRDFIVTIDSPNCFSWNYTEKPKGVMVTHKLTGIFEQCKIFQGQHTNKAKALSNVIKKLKELGWQDEI